MIKKSGQTKRKVSPYPITCGALFDDIFLVCMRLNPSLRKWAQKTERITVPNHINVPHQHNGM